MQSKIVVPNHRTIRPQFYFHPKMSRSKDIAIQSLRFWNLSCTII